MRLPFGGIHWLLLCVASPFGRDSYNMMHAARGDLFPGVRDLYKEPTGSGRDIMVRVYVFDRQGKLVGPVDSPRVELSDQEWQRRLTPEQYEIARDNGTERAFCGNLLDNKQEG